MLISPLSGSSDITLLKTIPSEELIIEWKRQYNIDVTEELHGHKEIYLYQCNQTKLNFFLPLDIAGSKKLYEQLGDLDWYYKDKKWEYDMAMKDLKGCQRILEVGCGKGLFVRRLREKCKLDAIGIELNTKAIRYALSKGIPALRIDLHDFANKNPCCFDAACAFQVLEHVPDPYEFLSSLIKIVRPGGRLIITVPNSDSFLKYAPSLLNLPPHHMSQWSRKVFDYLLLMFPLKIRKIIDEPLAYDNIDFYLLAQILRFSEKKILQKLAFYIGHYMLKPLLKRSFIARSLIVGHTLYVCLERI